MPCRPGPRKTGWDGPVLSILCADRNQLNTTDQLIFWLVPEAMVAFTQFPFWVGVSIVALPADIEADFTVMPAGTAMRSV